jgi:tetrahydromethanopterin S-methyltransferase subunit G
MKLMRSTWTDFRLDDFKSDVDSRLGELSQRITDLSSRVDGLQHTMIYGFIAIMVGMLTGFLGLAGVLITKL